MANEFQLLPNPTNIPEAVSTGYQRQNTNIFVLQTGLDTTDPYLTNNGTTIAISSGGLVENNGSLFELKSDTTISIPNVNNDYFIFIHDNGDKTANIDISPDYPTFNHSKNGWYTSNNERVLSSFYMRKILVKRDSNNENIDPVTFIDLEHTVLYRFSLENMASLYWYAAASLGDGSVLFGGGYTSESASSGVYKYDTNGIRTFLPSLSIQKYGLAAATLGNGSVLFGGGFYMYKSGVYTYTGLSDTVDKYDTNGVMTTLTPLSVARENLKAATLGDGSVLFGGGANDSGSVYDTVDKYDTNGVRTTLTPLSVGRSQLSAASLGDGSVLFGGGEESSTFTYPPSSVVDKYDTNGVRTTLENLSVARSDLAAATFLEDGSVLFGGGTRTTYGNTTDAVDKYDMNGVRITLMPLSTARSQLSAATLGNGYVLFGGGNDSSQKKRYGSVDMYNYSTVLNLSYSSKYRFEDDTAEQTGVTQVIKKTPIKGYVRQ
jgi:hypothetical protein